MAGYAGACLAFATERFSTATFDPTISFIIISMVVIGGLGSIAGAVLGALYLEGLPALFGANPTIQFLTSGLGLIAFILYLPGDLVTMGVRALGDRLSPGHPGPPPAELFVDGLDPLAKSEPLVPGVVES
jgi:ABC-type branched-subunit amino acid transport system permease subunit